MRTITLLIFPEFQLLDAAGPIAAFEATGRDTEAPAYRLEIIAADAGPVRSSSGAALYAQSSCADDPIDTFLVAGGWGTRRYMHCRDMRELVLRNAARARRVASVCSGALLLAAAGLLDGRRATTHWRVAAELGRRFPAVQVEPDHIYVRDGPIWTSAGISAGIDLALALIAEDLGEAAAKRVAQQLVVYYRRPGGQSQFSALAELDRPGCRFGPLLAWARAHLNERLQIDRLADHAAMSPRNFARAFTAETGVTPAKAIERLRLEAARQSVEASPEPIDQVAAATGFGDPERMRRAFIRAFGQPPQALRRAARVSVNVVQ